jgi:Na+/glutamate symporter
MKPTIIAEKTVIREVTREVTKEVTVTREIKEQKKVKLPINEICMFIGIITGTMEILDKLSNFS